MLFEFPSFTDPGVWISLLTLCFLEIVLGIDNIIFISIVAGKLPEQQQRKARNLGLGLAMLFRIGLLLCINWIIGMTEPVVTLKIRGSVLRLSVKDLILVAGGIFLIVKSTLEIHHKLQNPTGTVSLQKAPVGFSAVIIQIVLVDAVFSFDSILTAVGLVDYVSIMIIAVVVSILVVVPRLKP